MNFYSQSYRFIREWLYFGTILILFKYQIAIVNCCELKAFKEHLDFHHLKHAILVQNRLPLTTIPKSSKHQLSMAEDQFEKSILTEFMNNYYLKFFNTRYQNPIDNKKDFQQLFHNIWARVGLFMSYNREDEGKRNILLWASENGWFNYSVSWFVLLKANNNGEHLANIRQAFGHLDVMLNADITVAFAQDNR